LNVINLFNVAYQSQNYWTKQWFYIFRCYL